jgi:hypothetical protein
VIFAVSARNCLILSSISSRARRKASIFWLGDPSAAAGSLMPQ